MTKVQIERQGCRCRLSAQGHATGSGEVCAAVSGLLCALAGYLTNAVRDRYVEIYEWRMESADVLLEFCGDTGALAAFEMAAIGLMQIEKAHPKYIQVDFREK